MSSALQELLKMPVEDKSEAINQIWDSIDTDRIEFSLTEDEKAELDRRLDDLEKNPGIGCGWDELRAKLTHK